MKSAMLQQILWDVLRSTRLGKVKMGTLKVSLRCLWLGGFETLLEIDESVRRSTRVQFTSAFSRLAYKTSECVHSEPSSECGSIHTR